MILINAFIITVIHGLSWFRLRSDTENVKREAESAKNKTESCSDKSEKLKKIVKAYKSIIVMKKNEKNRL